MFDHTVSGFVSEYKTKLLNKYDFIIKCPGEKFAASSKRKMEIRTCQRKEVRREAPAPKGRKGSDNKGKNNI